MTQDEVIKELRDVVANNQQFTTWTVSTPHLVELVNRAVKAEREACAELCELQAKQWSDAGCFDVRDFKLCAAAIRARGQA
jgi:hypothetical protein